MPLVLFEDVLDFLPDMAQKHSGIILPGAKLLYAFYVVTIPSPPH
jgi:acetyl-CoA carboxylase carboxyltransferase component